MTFYTVIILRWDICSGGTKNVWSTSDMLNASQYSLACFFYFFFFNSALCMYVHIVYCVFYVLCVCVCVWQPRVFWINDEWMIMTGDTFTTFTTQHTYYYLLNDLERPVKVIPANTEQWHCRLLTSDAINWWWSYHHMSLLEASQWLPLLHGRLVALTNGNVRAHG